MKQKQRVVANLTKVLMASIVAAIIVVACQKSTNKEESSGFNSLAAKEWYYGIFKKSNEFLQSNEKGRKLPDWKKGIYRKVGDMEIVEFPLVKEKTIFAVQSGNALTNAEIKRVANASLSRIAFIKKPNNEIVIRELDYIPEWNYLQAKGFDISDVNLGNKENKFSGRIVTKKWNGQILSYRKLTEGMSVTKGIKKLSSNGKVAPTNNLIAGRSQGCETYEICEYSRNCDERWAGDAWIPAGTCSEWMPTGLCWTEEYCEPEGCNYGSTVSCECQLYGLGCDGNGGGQGEEPQCNMTSEEAAEIADASISGSKESYETTKGAPILFFENGIEKKEVPEEWNFFTSTVGLSKIEYCVDYTLKLFRSNSNSQWKFESLKFISKRTKSGTYPMCINGTMTVNEVANNISTDLSTASSTIAYEYVLEATCLLGAEIRRKSNRMTANFTY